MISTKIIALIAFLGNQDKGIQYKLKFDSRNKKETNS